MIAIFSISDDLHALAVREALRIRGMADVVLIETDRVAATARSSIEISSHSDVRSRTLLAGVPISEFSTIWYRRARSPLRGIEHYEPNEREFIENECRGLMNAISYFSDPDTRWVSRPDSTYRACDKVHQLRVAAQAGFRVPRTLVTQSKAQVISFWEACERNIIVKPLVGVREPFLLTRHLADPRALDEEAFSICPAIYQENIPGTRHIRLNCFGDRFVAAAIDSEELDWRPDLNVPITPWEVPNDVRSLVRRTLSLLDLEMGAIDIKVMPSGELCWLEVNPQGQFLFLDPFLKVSTAHLLADFLADVDTRARP
jgi:glutathione synthase/RimK-type ligase-like ATP-grasp enzyme